MTEEKTSKMNINIGKRVRNYLIFFVILILFLIWGNDIAGLITTSITGSKDSSEAARKVITSIITAIGGVAVILLNLGRDIDLHNFLDKTFFHVRQKTGRIIHNEMIKASQGVGANGYQNMQDKEREVLYLFYHFVNEQPVLRDLAFTYWEQYFVNIYIIFFGVIGFIISSILVLFHWKIEVSIIPPFLFLMVIIIISLSTKNSLVKKIYDLPIQQIVEIRTTKSNDLKEEVEKRFGKVD